MLSLLLAVKALPCVTAKWKRRTEQPARRRTERPGRRGTEHPGRQGLGSAPRLFLHSPSFDWRPPPPSSQCSGDGSTPRSPDRPATLWVSLLNVEEVMVAADRQLCAPKPPALLSAFRPTSANACFPSASLASLTVSPGLGCLGALLQPAVHLGDPGAKPGRRWFGERTPQGWKLRGNLDSRLDAPDLPGSSASLAGGPMTSMAPPQMWNGYAPGTSQQMLPFTERLPRPQPEGCAQGKDVSLLPGDTKAPGLASWLNWSALGCNAESSPNLGAGERDNQRFAAERGNGSHFPTSPYLLGKDPSTGNIRSPQLPPATTSDLLLPGSSQEPPSPLQNWENPSNSDEFVEIALDDSLPTALPEIRACWGILKPLMEFWTKFLPSLSLKCFGEMEQDPDPREKSEDETLSDTSRVRVKLEPPAPGTDVWGKILALSSTRRGPLLWGKAFTDLLFQELFKPTTVTEERQGMADPRLPSTQTQAEPPTGQGSKAALGQWDRTQDTF